MVHCIEHVAGTVHLSHMKIMAMMMIRIKVSTTVVSAGCELSVNAFSLRIRWKLPSGSKRNEMLAYV
jgi:hypothetical protein